MGLGDGAVKSDKEGAVSMTPAFIFAMRISLKVQNTEYHYLWTCYHISYHVLPYIICIISCDIIQILYPTVSYHVISHTIIISYHIIPYFVHTTPKVAIHLTLEEPEAQRSLSFVQGHYPHVGLETNFCLLSQPSTRERRNSKEFTGSILKEQTEKAAQAAHLFSP